MPIVRTGESVTDKELARWDTPKRDGGHRCNGFEPYPAMVYRATRDETGIVRLAHRQVVDEHAHDQATREGWHVGPTEAHAALELLEQAVAQAAAEAAHTARRMSVPAQREQAAADAQTAEHVTDVPAPKRRGRPAKKVTAVSA